MLHYRPRKHIFTELFKHILGQLYHDVWMLFGYECWNIIIVENFVLIRAIIEKIQTKNTSKEMQQRSWYLLTTWPVWSVCPQLWLYSSQDGWDPVTVKAIVYSSNQSVTPHPIVLEETTSIRIEMFLHRIKIITENNFVLICSDPSL